MSDEIETQQPEATGREVAKVPLEVGDKGYIAPRTVEEAARMAEGIIRARLAPDSYNNDPGKIVLGIMAALEAGLPPLYGLRQIAIINGRPTIWGDGAMALVQSKNLITDYRETQIGPHPSSDDLSLWPPEFGYEVQIKRRGQEGEYIGRFTVGDAKRAKLWNNARKTPWMEHPLRMLKIRARSFALRDGFADALGGIAIREEVEDTFGPDEVKPPEILLSDEPVAEVPPMPEEKGA